MARLLKKLMSMATLSLPLKRDSAAGCTVPTLLHPWITPVDGSRFSDVPVALAK